MHVNDLTDKNLVAIFNNLSLRDLLRLELVCRRWRTVHYLACYSRENLSILSEEPSFRYEELIDDDGENFGFGGNIGGNAANNNGDNGSKNRQEPKNESSEVKNPLAVVKILYNQYGIEFDSNFHRLKVKELNEGICQFLVGRFPSISQLEVIVHDLLPVVDNVISLLLNWPTLNKLKVVAVGSKNSTEAWNLLALSINSLTPFLRHLTLYHYDHSGCLPFNQLTEMHCLEEFYCGRFQIANPREALKLTENFILIRNFGLLGIEYTQNADEFLAAPSEDNFPMHSNQINKLIYCTENSAPFLTAHYLTSCSQSFNSLGALQLNNSPEDITNVYKLVKCLAPLIHLRELRMVYFVRLFTGHGELEWRRSGKVQLTALTQLHLDCEFVPHAEFDAIDQLMPNLSLIKLEGYQKCCRDMPESDFPLLGTECYPSIEEFRKAASDPPFEIEELRQRRLGNLLKRCEDNFTERPFVRRLLELNEIWLGKGSMEVSQMGRNDPLLVQYRVCRFYQGRRLLTSMKFICL